MRFCLELRLATFSRIDCADLQCDEYLVSRAINNCRSMI